MNLGLFYHNILERVYRRIIAGDIAQAEVANARNASGRYWKRKSMPQPKICTPNSPAARRDTKRMCVRANTLRHRAGGGSSAGDACGRYAAGGGGNLVRLRQ